jgi:hypothetical protein
MANLHIRRGMMKPPPGALINPSHPFALGEVLSLFALDGQGTFSSSGPQYPQQTVHFGSVIPNALAITGTPTWASNTDGTAIQFTTTTTRIDCGAVVLPTAHGTFLYIGRKTDTTNRQATPFSVALGTTNQDTDFLSALLPFTDGKIYWDYGYNPNFLAPNRLSVTPPTIGTLVHRWIFSAGPLGSAIWQDGVKIASQSTAITRTNGTTAKTFNVGDSTQTSTVCDNFQLNFLSVVDAQWSDEMCRWWSAEPYAHLYGPETQRRYYFLGGAAAGQTFQSAWARNANTVIQPGIR